MAKPELGTKRLCVNCATRFYDLGRVPAICPKCETEQPIEQPRARRASGGNPVEDKRPKKVVPVEAEAEAEAPEDEAEEDVLDDAADLEEEDDAEAISDVEVEPDTDDPER